MSSPQLTEYVRQRLAAGESNETIREELKRTGWGESDIQAVMGTPAAAPAAVHAPISASTSSAAPKRLALIVGIVAGILVLAGGASAAYFFYFKEDPEKILAQAISGMMDVNAFEYGASLRVEATTSATSAGAETLLPLLGGASGEAAPIKLLLTLDGAMDRTDRAKPKTSFGIKIASTAVANGSPIVGLSVRQLEDATYLSLTEAPSNMFIDLSPIVGVWIKIDPKGLAKQIAGTAATDESSAPKETMTEDQKTKIRGAFVELRPVRVEKVLKEEGVDGVASRHFQLAIDQAALEAFVLRTQSIMNGEASLAYEKFNDDYKRYSKETEITSFEIWIGKESGLPTRIRMEMTVKATGDVPADGTATFDMKLKNFNQVPVIEVPAEAKTFEEIFEQLMDGAFGGDVRAEETKRISNIRQIQTALELGYSEANTYPIALQPILVGNSTTQKLCIAKKKFIWTENALDCDGTVQMGLSTNDPSIQHGSYVYRSTDGRSYTLQFTLTEDSGELTAGPQCASQDGIVSLPCTMEDLDGDGLSDADEARYGSDARNPDTDGDRFTDGAEVAAGYDPAGPGKL